MAYLFGVGKGHLSVRAARAARREGAELINYTGPECECGYRCAPYTCRKNQKHWFALPSGWGQEGRAQAVLEAVHHAATQHDREVLGLEDKKT
jgi:hypothetical protein